MNKMTWFGAFLYLSAAPYALAVEKAQPPQPDYYGSALCKDSNFECIQAPSGKSWETLFPDEIKRDIVQRINRTYNALWSGKTIVVPKHLDNATLLDFAPFPLKIQSIHEKQIIIDQNKLAWGAYDADGHLVKWGPISSGSTRCSDNSSHSCLTLTGMFRMFSKEDSRCRSDVYPIGRGGAPMPYCMYFHKGFALHGAQDVPGYRASHGCVRLFTRDALWLNQEFVDILNERTNQLGTIVIVRPVTSNS
jgi:hypothetical protein